VEAAALKRFARSSAASFLVESTHEDGKSTEFQLFHQALNDALLRSRAKIATQREDEQALTESFMAIGKGAGWDYAPAYLLRSLPGHAGRSGLMDDLLRDDNYLLYADLLRILPIADQAKSIAGRRRARLVRLAPPMAIAANAANRAAMLSVTETLEGLGDTYLRMNANLPYQAAWARARASSEHSVLRGHSGPVNAICAFTLAGTIYLATASSDRSVRIWDPTTSTQRATLTGYTDSIHSICAFILDGVTYLATAGNDGTVRIWDPATGTQRNTLSGHDGGVNAVCAFTLDGTARLATAGEDRTVRI
jgi:hypothetical protein